MMLTNRKLLGITIISGLIFSLFFWYFLPKVDIGNDYKKLSCLDVLSGYSVDYVNLLFSSLGPNGLISYKNFIYVDCIYILSYTTFSVFLMKWLFLQSGKLIYYLKLSFLLPFFLALTDILENINTLVLIHDFPKLDVHFVNFASIITEIKWLTASLLAGFITCIIFYVYLRYIFWKFKYLKIK